MKIDLRIESKAQDLLEKHRMSTLPIAVEELAKKENANVFPFDLGDDVSGILHITNGVANIGYNPTESKVRQRFTIAHELGHLTLHREKGQVFVDNEKYYQFIIFRKSKLSDDDMEIEQEANAFAAALLMPLSLIQEELLGYDGFDLSDNRMINELAKKFEVSTQAMSFRILNLNNSNRIQLH